MTSSFRRDENPLSMRQWIEEGPYTLLMSSGFFGFFAHCGVLHALEEEGLLPSAVAGVSAGALVTGLWASGCGADDLAERLRTLTRKEFWDPSWSRRRRRGAQIETLPLGWLRGELFREALDELVGVERFERARVPAKVVVFDVRARRVRAIDAGPITPAIHASCAVPGLFRPVRVGGAWCIDGGVADRPGVSALKPGERVLFHHLESRSPWRRRGSESLSIPAREGLRAYVIPDLPRVGPYRLDAGREAYTHALRVTRSALRLSPKSNQI